MALFSIEPRVVFTGKLLATLSALVTSSNVPQRCKKRIAEDRDAHGFLPIKGGGVFKVACGQVTDDTEMAMAIARSLLRQGRYDDADVACSFFRWYCSNPFDIGTTTSSALHTSCAPLKGDKWFEKVSAEQKQDILKEIVENAKSDCMTSLSNGCLMRISPIAIAGLATDTKLLLDVVALNCRLTNPNEITVDGVRCYVAALKTLLETGDAKEAYTAALSCAKTATIGAILKAAQEKPIPVDLDGRSPTNGDEIAIGYIGVALQGAMFELLHAESFEQGLIRTVERGGDTDTNGCISGALLGAKFGADHIPQQWKQAVVSAKLERHQTFPEVILNDLEAIVEQLMKIRLA